MKIDGKFCSVPQCNSKGTDVPRPCFHFFPRELENNPAIHLRQAQWCAALRIGKPITKHFVVCSKHFTKNDYVPSRKTTVITQRLKKTAIPSQNLPVSASMDDEIKTPAKHNKGKSSSSKKISKTQLKRIRLNVKQKNKHDQNTNSSNNANDRMQSEECQNDRANHCIVEEGNPLPLIGNQLIVENSQTFCKQNSDYYVPQMEINPTSKNVNTLRENGQIQQSNSQINEEVLCNDIQNGYLMQINNNYPQKNALPQNVMKQTDSNNTMEKNFLKQAYCTDMQKNALEQINNKNILQNVIEQTGSDNMEKNFQKEAHCKEAHQKEFPKIRKNALGQIEIKILEPSVIIIQNYYPQKIVLEQINNNSIPQNVTERTDNDTMEKNFLNQAYCTDMQKTALAQTEIKNLEPSASNIQNYDNYKNLKTLSPAEISFSQINHHLVKRNLHLLLKCKIPNNENSIS